jgi:hypothetical protein
MRSISLAILSASVALGFSPALVSLGQQIVVVPPGLAPGSQYRLVFVTSATRDGMADDVAVYNNFVSTVANGQPLLSALGTTWSAVASTQTVDARDNTGTNWTIVGSGVPFYRLDGARVAPNNSYFWNMAYPEATISYTELGTRTPITVQSSTEAEAPWVWAGTTSGGTKSTGYLGVNSGSASGFPVAGVAYNEVTGPYSWIGLATTPDEDVHALYGMSGVLTVPGAILAGDYNDDGVVDAADYVLWRRLNGTSTVMPNDPNSLPIDGDQYNTWRGNFGESAAGSGQDSPVPEPAAFVTMMSGVVLVLIAAMWRKGARVYTMAGAKGASYESHSENVSRSRCPGFVDGHCRGIVR